jgi:ribonucleotide monophosphatase NagD (HAD superfamily)
MAELLRARFGETGWVVGDRPETDGLMARQLGWRFGLVLSGITTEAEAVDPRPDAVGTDLADLVAQVLA